MPVPSHIPPGRGLLVSAFAAVVAFLFGAAICNDFLVAQKRWMLREIAQDAAIAAVLVLSDETASPDKTSHALAAAKSVADARAPTADADVTLSPGALRASVRLADEKPAVLGDSDNARPKRIRVSAMAAFSKPSTGAGAQRRLGRQMGPDRSAESLVPRPRG
jgi:hypothetical protein